MSSILVTGGAGYIGSHTVQKLLSAGHSVVVVDNLSTGFKEAVPEGAAFYEIDILNQTAIENVLTTHPCHAVIHFAAKLNVQESVSQPLEYYVNNVQGVLSVLGACKKFNIQKLIFSSTAALFGDRTQDRNIQETDPVDPLNPYGLTKKISEEIMASVASEWGLRFIFLRYFNVAGGARDGSNGQRTENAFHLVHLAAQAATGQREKLSIFGTDYSTPDGTCIRDYIHVEDLASIHVKAYEHLQKGHPSNLFNCGYGRGHSVLEVIETMKKVSGVDFKTEIASRRPGDAAKLVADPSKLLRELQWKAECDNLELICETALKWEQKMLLKKSMAKT